MCMDGCNKDRYCDMSAAWQLVLLVRLCQSVTWVKGVQALLSLLIKLL